MKVLKLTNYLRSRHQERYNNAVSQSKLSLEVSCNELTSFMDKRLGNTTLTPNRGGPYIDLQNSSLKHLKDTPQQFSDAQINI